MSAVKKQPAKGTFKTPSARVKNLIHQVRGRQVMLDQDLAELYGVETKRLMQQVRRNRERFPADFMIQLNKEEVEILRSQDATSREGHGGRRYRPYVFTEQGVAMLSSVLRSKQAVAVNVEIMRAFVEMRRAAHSHDELVSHVRALEKAVAARLSRHDQQLAVVFEVIRELEARTAPKQTRAVGFRTPETKRK